jgi:hypothetical protein
MTKLMSKNRQLPHGAPSINTKAPSLISKPRHHHGADIAWQYNNDGIYICFCYGDISMLVPAQSKSESSLHLFSVYIFPPAFAIPAQE